MHPVRDDRAHRGGVGVGGGPPPGLSASVRIAPLSEKVREKLHNAPYRTYST